MRSWAAAAVVLVVLYSSIAILAPNTVGVWQDDAIYLATARSVAEGKGYRHIEMPGEPKQTKYPPLYPLLLAPAFSAWSFPSNRPAVLLPGAIAATVMVIVAGLYLRRHLRVGGSAGWLLVVLAGLSPPVISMVRFAMSDLLYGALATGALLCIDGSLHPWSATPNAGNGETLQGKRGWLAAAALLTALAMLTRGIGVTLAVAGVACFLLARRYRAALGYAAALILCMLPWWFWQAAAVSSNALPQGGPLATPELRYGLWLPDSAWESLRVAGQNAVRLAFALLTNHLGAPVEWVRWALGTGRLTAMGIHVIAYAILALIVVGFARSWRQGRRSVHLYLLLYAGLVLVWPFEPSRFMIPWTPFLLYFLANGTAAFGRAGVARRRLPKAGLGMRSPLLWSGAVIVLAFASVELVRIVRSTETSFYGRMPVTVDGPEDRALDRWIRDNTPRDAVIASGQPARIFLATGRKGYYFWPDPDPYKVYNGRDRELKYFFYVSSPAERRWMERQISEKLLLWYREAEVGFYVEELSGSLAAGLVRTRIDPLTNEFLPLYTTPAGRYRIYAVRLGGE